MYVKINVIIVMQKKNDDYDQITVSWISKP